MVKKAFMFLVFGLLLVGSVSAISVDYYFHPKCGHCQKIAPFMEESQNIYKNVEWNILDTSNNKYDVSGTPFLKIITDDNRHIELGGSFDIPRYLRCELSEQSNLNCPTYSANECRSDSWFIK